MTAPAAESTPRRRRRRLLPPIARRQGGERFLLLMIVAFAMSVVAVRWWLELTGFPQVGGGTLHIAHMLWGGLLLFAGALLPLVIANRFALTVSAILTGVGAGLFIDEVGKFITQTNDYFYPGAAPIIYGCFLGTILVYVLFRRQEPLDPPEETYAALDQIAEYLDGQLDETERELLVHRLERIAAQDDHPDLGRLASGMLAFADGPGLTLERQGRSVGDRILRRTYAVESRLLPRPRFRWLLVAGFVALFVGALVVVAAAVSEGLPGLQALVREATAQQHTKIQRPGNVAWYVLQVVLQGGVGIGSVVAAVQLARGSDATGARVGLATLAFALTAVSLVSFYVNQFDAVIAALYQGALLGGLVRYRDRYVRRRLGPGTVGARSPKPPAGSSTARA